ncbi:MAG: hypothetical protein HKM95_02535 [Inquilinus sp.]|nr:hypothetical protein [Inquilinus sp.]
MMIVARILTATGTLALSACTMAAAFDVSEPFVDTDSAARIDGDGVILLHEQLTVSVVPRNEVMLVLGMGLVVPIPLGVNNDPRRQDLPLLVDLRFAPTTDGFTFVPSDIQLHYNGNAAVPNRSTALDTRTGRVSGESRHAPGHRWECTWHNYWEFLPSAAGEEVALSKGCLGLEFPIDTIHPEQSFAVHLNGFRFRGVPLEPVEVRFRRDTRFGFVLMGVGG